MGIKKLLVIFAFVSALTGVTAGAWAFGDAFGFRFALKFEVDDVRVLAAASATKLQWLEFESLESIKKRRALTAKECAKFLVLGKILGVPATC